MRIRSLLRANFQPIELATLFGYRVMALRGDRSAHGEQAHLSSLCDALGLHDGYVVDMAASDGVTQSCMLPFFRSPAWSGLAVEMDERKFKILSYAYAMFVHVALAKCRVTPTNVSALLSAFEVPTQFDVLNLDIDSYDLLVIESILKAGFRPKLITMEINEKIPPPLYFTVRYDDDWYWQGDHFYGCSATAAAETVKPYGYVLSSIEYNNAFFIDESVASSQFADMSVEAAYDAGYRNRANRRQRFPHNADVDAALDMSPSAAVDFFVGYFAQYEGRFELHVRE